MYKNLFNDVSSIKDTWQKIMHERFNNAVSNNKYTLWQCNNVLKYINPMLYQPAKIPDE